jgi:3'-phosphoadenosine 5'-phosphosulfate sulfotransferase (PAPS reductase)/FAD synthetase
MKLMDEAVETYGVSKFFALFSGGHDSLCATHIAMQHPLCNDVVHINTGIGVEVTRQFVRDVCKAQGWNLIEIRAKEDCGQDYEELVVQHGFPGPFMHNKMYCRLKERCLNFLMRHYTEKKQRVGFISGVRSDESARRMRHVERLQHEGRKVWVAVCHDWTKQRQAEYMAEHNLPRNPVKEKMCMSGECLCGAFAQKNELNEWLFHFPDDPGIQKLLAIRDKVLEKFPWDWDDAGPPKWWQEKQAGQIMMFADAELKREHLCVNCNRRGAIQPDP